MGEGAALSMETADVTLLDSNLEKLDYAVRMGQRVTGKITQNVVFSIGSKVLVLAFALTTGAPLWAAIGADVGAMLIVTLNAMTLLPRRPSSSALNISNDREQAMEGTNISSDDPEYGTRPEIQI